MTERTVGNLTFKTVKARDDPGMRGTVQTVQQLHRIALPAVRAKALAWRNGLAGLLAGLVGFGLVKGQSDVSTLAWPGNLLAGLALLAALIAGGFGAHQLLLAAHGQPERVEASDTRSALAADVMEAERAARAMKRGVASSAVCVVFLAITVATTWYAPVRDGAEVEMTTSDRTVCGSVVRVRSDVLTLRTASGEQSVVLSEVIGLRPVAKCGG
jgi:hypothetical protein